MSHLKPEISQVNGCKCLEVGPTACQTWGLLISLECNCNWLPLFEKNKAENRPLGNFSSFSFKVLPFNLDKGLSWKTYVNWVLGDIKFFGETATPSKLSLGPGKLIAKRWALSGAVFLPPHSGEIWPPVCYDFWQFFCFALSESGKRHYLPKF